MSDNCMSQFHITGYAMHTVAGSEHHFDYERMVGYTNSIDCDWNHCIDNSDVKHVYKCIQKTIDRALSNAKLDVHLVKNASLIIASNFLEDKFLEINDENSTASCGNYITSNLKKRYAQHGVLACNSTACASGASAVVTACQLIADNQADIAIVVGYEVESSVPKNGLKRVGAVSKTRIAPFSSGRTGTDLSDGVGVLIIESASSVSKRSAFVFSIILGYGIGSDAHNVTMPDPSGKSLVTAMKDSIRMSNIKESEITYINSHGSGTRLNDLIETRAIKEIFKNHAYKLLINSSKSLIGHTIGAAGVIELIITIMQMHKGKVHPTANFNGRDKECDLNYCFESSVDSNIKYAISNSIGFGGINVSILLVRGVGYD